MTSVERQFERWRAQKMDVLGLSEKLAMESAASTSGGAMEGTLAEALKTLHRAERLRTSEAYDKARETYDACLREICNAWMNGTAETSALVASACGMLEGAEATRGACAVVAYRAAAGAALSGRALVAGRTGDWVAALRDAEAAIDCAPDYALTHARLGDILRETQVAGDAAVEYEKFAEALKGKRMNGLSRSSDFAGDSADELQRVASAHKCIEDEDWVRARRSMLYGAGVLFAERDDERIYRDRLLFLERAKTIFVMNNANETSKSSSDPKARGNGTGTWLDNAFSLAEFDNLSAYDRAHVCLTLGNIFGWIGDFAGASELYSCALSVISNTEMSDASEALDDLQPVLEANRVLCQYRNNQTTKAWRNVRKLMAVEQRKTFAPGFLRVAEIACSKKGWESAEQSFRIAGRLDASFQVRHKVLLSQRAALQDKPAVVDVEQFEELDKIQEGTEMDFSETPRFAQTSKQNSLNDKSVEEHYALAAEEIINELQDPNSPDSHDTTESTPHSKIFTGRTTRSLRMTEVLNDLDGGATKSRKRKTRTNSCSCTEMFSFLGWGSLDVRESSAEEEVFLASLLDPLPPPMANDDADDMDLDSIIEAATPAPIEVEESPQKR